MLLGRRRLRLLRGRNPPLHSFHRSDARKSRVFTLNLRNRLIFKAADEEGAVESAEFLGKRKTIKRFWGYSAGKRSSNYSEMTSTRSSRTCRAICRSTLRLLCIAKKAIAASCCHEERLMGRFADGSPKLRGTVENSPHSAVAVVTD
jgi:hypothetical protein